MNQVGFEPEFKYLKIVRNPALTVTIVIFFK